MCLLYNDKAIVHWGVSGCICGEKKRLQVGTFRLSLAYHIHAKTIIKLLYIIANVLCTLIS